MRMKPFRLDCNSFCLSRRLALWRVINGGVPGYCPLLSWLKFDQDLAKLKPDLVILHVDMSDVADDLCYRSLLMNEDNHAVCSHPMLRLKLRNPNSIEGFVKQSATASWLFTTAREQGPGMLSLSTTSTQADLFDWIGDDPPDLRLQVRHALEPITRLKESVEATGGRLLVTTAPVLWQVVSAENAPELSRRYGIRGADTLSQSLSVRNSGGILQSRADPILRHVLDICKR